MHNDGHQDSSVIQIFFFFFCVYYEIDLLMQMLHWPYDPAQ